MNHLALNRWTRLEPSVRAMGASARGHVGADEIKPLKATPNIITAKDIDSYIALLDPLIATLGDDAHAQIVYDDPKSLEGKASLLTADVLKPVREKLLAEAQVLRERMKGKSADQIALEQNWGSDFRALQAQWEVDKKAVGGAIVMTTGGDWSRLQGDDLNYQRLRARFVLLGGKSSREVPVSEPATPAISASSVPWWAWVLGVAVVGGGAYVALK